MAGIGHNRKSRSTTTLTLAEKDKLKKAITELENSMTRVSSEKSLQKEIVDNVAEEIGIEKALVRRLGRTSFKANFKEEEEAQEEFKDFWSILTGFST